MAVAAELHTIKVRFLVNKKTETRSREGAIFEQKEGSTERIVSFLESDHKGIKTDTKITGAWKNCRKCPSVGLVKGADREFKFMDRYTRLVENPRDPVANDMVLDALAIRSGANQELAERTSKRLCRRDDGWVLAIPDVIPGSKYCPNSIAEYAGLGDKRPSETLALDVRRHLCFLGWKIECVRYKKGASCFRFRYTSPDGTKVYMSLRLLCCDMKDAAVRNSGSVPQDCLPNNGIKIDNGEERQKRKRISDAEAVTNFLPKPKRGKEIGMMRELRRSLKANNQPTRVLRSSKAFRPQIDYRIAVPNCSEKAVKTPSEARHFVEGIQSQPTCQESSTKKVIPTSSGRNPRTVLSWLIDNNVVSLGDKVHYRNCMKEGRITREGIKCGCCGNLFTLTTFEAHAGSSNHRPAANILLEDGRTLQDCQKKVEQSPNIPIIRKHRVKGKQERTQGMDKNDNICSVCHDGGDLILCDKCPSSFHKSCLGLEDIPDGDWYCFSCRCCICGQIGFKEDVQESEVVCFISCEQCHSKYHVGCLNREEVSESERENCLKGKTFCGSKCEDIFAGLQKLLGRPITVAEGDLTWTLVKSSETDISDHSKLNAALEVMHECFEPVKDAYTGRDVVEDIIYGRGSDLKRMNCQGFYTALLERDNDVITVANVRIWGDKVAEVPVVGTRFQYRRLGMCRILMDELEKQLISFGVEKLVLPSATSTLATWINGFGFTELTESDRKQYSGVSFLDFQGTIMCQKDLRRSTTARSESGYLDLL